MIAPPRAMRPVVAVQSSQKGTAITGGLVSDEALDSSKSVLAPGRFGSGQRGFQQFYSPPELADLAAGVAASFNPATVLDPTAGNGALLSKLALDVRFGIEIDPDQIAAANDDVNGYPNPRRYNAIQGDLTKVAPLLSEVVPAWPMIVANPPFGLDWEIPMLSTAGTVNSAMATWRLCTDWLHPDGVLMFVCGKNRWHREIEPLESAAGVFAVLHCDDLFDGTVEPCAVAFATAAGKTRVRDWQTPVAPREWERATIAIAAAYVIDEYRAKTRNYPRTYWGHRVAWQDPFDAVRAEYKRVQKLATSKAEPTFNVGLVGGQLCDVHLNAFTRLKLAGMKLLSIVESLHKQAIGHFVLNEREWLSLVALAEQGIITVQPELVAAVDAMVANAKKTATPLYPLKPQQRLGYLADLHALKCVKDDPERGFKAGEMYPLSTRSVFLEDQEQRAVEVRHGKNKGNVEIRNYVIPRKVLTAKVGDWTFTDSQRPEDQGAIKYLIEHFEIRDPGDVSSNYPEEVDRCRDVYRGINDTLLENAGVGLRDFQLEDLARLHFRGSGILAWEQGLGKTLAGLAFAAAGTAAGCQDAALFIVPKDLIPQWQREAKKWFGRELTLLAEKQPTQKKGKKIHYPTIQAQAKALEKHLRLGGTGWFITYYEALSQVGTGRSELLPEIVVMEGPVQYQRVEGTGQYGWRDESGDPVPEGTPGAVHGWINEKYTEFRRQITSAHVCPSCHTKVGKGWNGTTCRGEYKDGTPCSYTHYLHRVKPAASLLATAFRRGTIIVDEGTLIQSDTSLRSRAVCGLRASRKLLMTGTPVKNTVDQAYWLMWWALARKAGDASGLGFPYRYHGGRKKFEQQFCVFEYYVNKGKKMGVKKRPEVTNLSILWRLLSSGIVRRRKEETGEKLVPRTYHVITTPLGTQQARILNKWLSNNTFAKLFREKYPDSDVVKAGMEVLLEPMLGLQAKLDYAATIPEADPDREWLGMEPSNWTPTNLKTLQLTMDLVAQGRKVLVGSNLLATSRWLAERLQEKGITAAHLLDSSGTTAPPAKRAETVHAFQTNKVQVLCAGIQAIRLGHNLDKSNAVVLNGLPWDWETFDQFVARVHRLTSEQPVDVYVVIPRDTLTAKRWETLNAKGQAAGLALDGRLFEQDEEKVDEIDIIREMQENGIPLVGDEVPEDEIEALWPSIPAVTVTQPPVVEPEADASPVETLPDLPVGLTPAPATTDDFPPGTFVVVTPGGALGTVEQQHAGRIIVRTVSGSRLSVEPKQLEVTDAPTTPVSQEPVSYTDEADGTPSEDDAPGDDNNFDWEAQLALV